MSAGPANGHLVSNGGSVRYPRPVGPWKQAAFMLSSAPTASFRNFWFLPRCHSFSRPPPPFHVASALHLHLSPLVLHPISIFYLPAPLLSPSKGLLLPPRPRPPCILTSTAFPLFPLCPDFTLCYFPLQWEFGQGTRKCQT